MKAMMAVVGALLVGFCAPLSARADVVVFQTGARFEGRVKEHGNVIEVQVPEGSHFFQKALVLRIERGLTRLDEFDKRRAALAPRDVEGRTALARFCDEGGLPSQALDLHREIVTLDPDNLGSRAKLGYMRLDGAWVTRESMMARLGLIQVRGEWMSAGVASQLEHARQALSDVRGRLASLENSQRETGRTMNLVLSQSRQATEDQQGRIRDLESELRRLREARDRHDGPRWIPIPVYSGTRPTYVPTSLPPPSNQRPPVTTPSLIARQN